jgi:hypothetical protein
VVVGGLVRIGRLRGRSGEFGPLCRGGRLFSGSVKRGVVVSLSSRYGWRGYGPSAHAAS